MFKYFAALLLSLSCIDCVSTQHKQPTWLTNNISLVKSGINGTVLIDAQFANEHRGGVGIVLDSRHVFVPAHVVNDSKSITVYTRILRKDGAGIQVVDEINGKVIAVNLTQDAALFESTTDINVQPMVIDTIHKPYVNEHVWYFGKSNAVRFGNISVASSIAGQMTDVVQVVIDANAGDSGAPLVNDDAHVIGFLYATSTDSKRTYFIPIGRALNSIHQ